MLPALAFILCGYALFYSLLARPWYTFARPGEQLALLAYPFASRWSRQKARRVLTARRTAYFEDRPKPLARVPRSGLGPMTGWVGPGEWMLPQPARKPAPARKAPAGKAEKTLALQWICVNCGFLASGPAGSALHRRQLCRSCAPARRFPVASLTAVDQATQMLLNGSFTADEARAHATRISEEVRRNSRSAGVSTDALCAAISQLHGIPPASLGDFPEGP